MYSAISLFTGAGGLDYGFESAGFRTAVSVEMDDKCVETLRANRSWPVIPGPIGELGSEELLRRAGVGAGEVDVLIGGPPCQPFSKSGFWATGEAKRLNDPRADTLREFFRVLRDTRPRAFLLENVEGLGFHGKNEAITLISAELTSINRSKDTDYRPELAVLNAADYGVPQLRRRLFMVGSRDGRLFRFPFPTHAIEDLLDGRQRYRTAWDALYTFNTVNDPQLNAKGKWAALLPSVPEGQNYLWHTDRGGGEPLFGWRRRYWSFLLKLSKTEPAWTLQAQPGPATGPFHWKNRQLGIREMARLQTFPDDIQIKGSHADARRQLGNAVPSLLAEVLAREIAQQLLGSPSYTSPAKLAIPPARTPPPPPEPVVPVPDKYLMLRGDHEAHPGTGKGYRAMTRVIDGVTPLR